MPTTTYPRLLREHRDPAGKLITRMVQLAPDVIAIDLECPEAHQLARHLLPKIPMAVHDRPGKPNSRWIYKIVKQRD